MKSLINTATSALVAATCLIAMVSSAEISDECLGCICQASTGCNRDQGCSEAGVCGPFLITWGFWSDAGKPALTGTKATDPNAYKNCVTDLYCASETIRSYARIFGKDCNGDGVIDCEDFVRIHKLGPGACGSATVFDTPFYKEFSKCKNVVHPK